MARELRIGANLGCWRRGSDGQVPALGSKGTVRDEELAKLKCGLARVKKKRVFLREAATFFARESS